MKTRITSLTRNLSLFGLGALALCQTALGQTPIPSNSGPAATTSTAVPASAPAPPPAAPTAPAPFTIKWYGFVRNDFSYDSRQTTNLREASVDLYPRDKSLDANGNDINAVGNTNMLAINSRLGVSFNGPDAFGAKTSGLVEFEFFGPSDAAVGGIRLRHAYAKLDFAKTQFGFGQWWHPLFVPECFPGVLNFNTGIPFQPFNRSPQIRMTNMIGKDLYLITALIAQRDFTSQGPAPGVGSDFLRNSAVPNLHAQLQYKSAKLVAGVAFDYKMLRPALSNGLSGTALQANTVTVGSSAIMGYVKVVAKDFTVKFEAVSGSNMTDHVMLGGYVAYGTVANNPTSYTPTQLTSIWGEIHGNGKKVVPGLFVGYCKNGGADAGGIASYGRGIGIGGRGIDNLVRVAPRIEFISGKFKFGGEYEYTAAAYGTSTNDAKVGNTETISNSRLLMVTTFSF